MRKRNFGHMRKVKSDQGFHCLLTESFLQKCMNGEQGPV